MSERLIRIGKISSVNAAEGMARVTYPDMDDSVTAELPVFCFTGEYRMPEVGAEVLVVHLANGSSAGVGLGRYWNKADKPPVDSGFYKELGEDAYLKFDDGKLTIHAPEIVLEGDKVTVKSPGIKLDGPVKTTADILAGNSVSALSHTHSGVHGETSGPH